MPISSRGSHSPAIFSAAPVLCESPRPSEPPALAPDWLHSLGARLQSAGYQQYLAIHPVTRVLTFAAWNVDGPASGALAKTAANHRNLTRNAVDMALVVANQACFVAFVLDAVMLELCSVFLQLAM